MDPNTVQSYRSYIQTLLGKDFGRNIQKYWLAHQESDTTWISLAKKYWPGLLEKMVGCFDKRLIVKSKNGFLKVKISVWRFGKICRLKKLVRAFRHAQATRTLPLNPVFEFFRIYFQRLTDKISRIKSRNIQLLVERLPRMKILYNRIQVIDFYMKKRDSPKSLNSMNRLACVKMVRY